MNPTQIAARLGEEFGSKIIASHGEDKHPRIHVKAEDWRPIAEFLAGTPAGHTVYLQVVEIGNPCRKSNLVTYEFPSL